MTRDEFADLLKNGLGWVHAPGTGFEYSNTGYSLLGRVIDEVSGQSYDSYITEHFLQPLGMTDTIWSVESATE
ncbi:serine hydrolase domain-containing protein, partial [Prevotella bivia]|nr:serine hydrolase domain-containing protein [Prevotella bivia]